MWLVELPASSEVLWYVHGLLVKTRSAKGGRTRPRA